MELNVKCRYKNIIQNSRKKINRGFIMPNICTTAYVQNRNIGESGRLISDIIKIANTHRWKVFW